ncbi:beta-N-acetylglucosaminidase domain-containing protein [Amycolatopsis jiangsuensis]|uniref:Hyaluronoglucosaminidase n=1 Tax=Amycolatopsis jiangsuensis TaxID=1181879 RepID=A0A840IU53_9PSEU|nr:beta-N-acetylglucosaminidase domain-containing protein [Amycolatopsis jiangsuensis]MBB4685059.1 hyaluronoglucosaminidase [Amycolatopsis jiangsuensis]
MTLPGRIRLAAVAVAGAIAATLALTQPAAAAPGGVPVVSPTPQQISSQPDEVKIPSTVVLVVDQTTDAAAKDLLSTLLKEHGAKRIITLDPDAAAQQHGLLLVRLGGPGFSSQAPSQAEGYALTVSRLSGILIAGRDGSGQYYGVQTLRQLLVPSGGSWAVHGVSVRDWPNMALRGSIEGFYGPPWSTEARLHQIAFLGETKANTYIYSPKDDAYLRAQWRDPYPQQELETLGQVVASATAHHVEFTYALSPGVSICFSSAADVAAVKAKFQSVYDLGVRSFSMPFDDISYTKWNCDGDQAAYGAPGQAAAGKAQVTLLNAITADFVKTHDGVRPLQTVPTEYSDLEDSPYKTELRENLDPSVVVQWTGTAVVPPSVTNDQARQVSTLYGRKVFLWDNYPVNDYGESAGRLLLAPYDHRDAGLSQYLGGIVSNPMNQEAASQIAEFGVADFSWNDAAYSAERSWPQALARLAGGDPEATAALTVFADLEHYGPSSGPGPWQPQAPVLAAKTADFWDRWNAGDHSASGELRAYAEQIRDAAPVIRDGRVDSAFVTDAGPWLDATALWGQAMVTRIDALTAAAEGDQDKARQLTTTGDSLVSQAQAVKTGNTNAWGVRQALVGDGVLDTFLSQARDATVGSTAGAA